MSKKIAYDSKQVPRVNLFTPESGVSTKDNKRYRVIGELDLNEDSFSMYYIATPFSRQMPVYATNLGQFFARAGYFTEREGQSDYLMIYTLGGSGRLKTVDGEYTLTAGTVAVIDCSDYQYYCTVGKDIWNFMWFHFNGVSAVWFYENRVKVNKLAVILDESGALKRAFHEILKYAENESVGTDLRISAQLLDIFAVFESSASKNSDGKMTAIRAVSDMTVKFIRDNFAEKITVSELAENVHLSKFHFLRVFRESLGVTPHEYINNVRIDESVILLLNTELSITQIAGMCGFADTSNYISQFKRVVGQTPAKFRKSSRIW